MKKPIIALIPLYDKTKDSYWMLPGYMKGIEQAGGIAVMLPMCEDPSTLQQLSKSFDGFLFTGGQDIDPALYQCHDNEKCEELCPQRDAMEPYLLKEVIALNKPVLGICRGIQMLNAVTGGTLYQDLSSEYPATISHRMKAPYNRSQHLVSIEHDSLLYDILKETQIGVNSCHHQAIKTLGNNLKPAAISEDGLIESVYMPHKKFVLAVQWHPEFSLTDPHYQKIFAAFVNAAK